MQRYLILVTLLMTFVCAKRVKEFYEDGKKNGAEHALTPASK